jgi:hypothetical protein
VDLTGPKQGPVTVTCEHSNEHSGFIKDGKFLDQLGDCQLLKEDSAPYS